MYHPESQELCHFWAAKMHPWGGTVPDSPVVQFLTFILLQAAVKMRFFEKRWYRNWPSKCQKSGTENDSPSHIYIYICTYHYSTCLHIHMSHKCLEMCPGFLTSCSGFCLYGALLVQRPPPCGRGVEGLVYSTLWGFEGKAKQTLVRVCSSELGPYLRSIDPRHPIWDVGLNHTWGFW